MKVIGICGSKGAGKSTAFEMLKQVYGLLLVEIPLAAHLKETCAAVSNLPLEYFTDQKYKEKELENYVVLDEGIIKLIFSKFFLEENKDFTYDVNVRPHISKVFTTPRQMLQYVGTEVLRPIDNLIHVRTVLKKCQKDRVTVVPDVRFNSEFNYFSNDSSIEFTALYINNNSAEAAASADSHQSELEYRDFVSSCIKIDNNGSLSELRINLLKVLDGKI